MLELDTRDLATVSGGQQTEPQLPVPWPRPKGPSPESPNPGPCFPQSPSPWPQDPTNPKRPQLPLPIPPNDPYR
jgi:hypothetical protein